MQQSGANSIIAAFVADLGNMKFRLLRFLLLAGLAIVTLQGCVYRMDIPQGNRIDPALLDRLEMGMTRNQVKFLLGTPAVIDPYRPERWHYVYFLKTGRDQKIEKHNMTLVFSGEELTTIEGSLNPG